MLKRHRIIMKKIVFVALFCLLLLPTSAFAHKLIPTDGTNIDYQSALEIPDPVISWAMYEKLEGNPLFYKFEAKKELLKKIDILQIKKTPAVTIVAA